MSSPFILAVLSEIEQQRQLQVKIKFTSAPKWRPGVHPFPTNHPQHRGSYRSVLHVELSRYKKPVLIFPYLSSQFHTLHPP